MANLSASEGTIYGRYGFSPASFQVRWELERAQADLVEDRTASETLELVQAEVVKAAGPALHERARRNRVGEVSAYPGMWDGVSRAARATDGPLRLLVHRGLHGEVDGIAHFRAPWSADPVLIGTVEVEAFEAVTPAAYAAVWRLLTDIDLSRRLVVATRPPDEPLRWMLANPGPAITLGLDDETAALLHSADIVGEATFSDRLC